MNNAEFINKAIIKHGGIYDYSEVNYINSRSKISIICKKHGLFRQKAKNHLAGQGCPECQYENLRTKLSLTTEEFIEKSLIIHGTKYDYTLVDYKNSASCVIIICPTHGQFLQTPNSHLRGRGCPKCKPTKYTTKEEFVAKANKIHGNYCYNKSHFRKVTDRIIIKCYKHGYFTQTVKNHLAGRGCYKCGANRPSKDELLQKLKTIHDNKYEYIIDTTQKNQKLTAICPIHGQFTQIIHNHLAGHGCPKCGYKSNNKLDIGTFESKANIVHNNKYTYHDYIDYHTNISIICKKHGSFLQTPSNHLAGNGCPRCALEHSAKHRSKGQFAISQFIEDIGYDIVSNDREIIKPYEIDIFIPKLNIGIEYHGDYFHSYNAAETKEQREKHLLKLELCLKHNIQLLQFYEHEWNAKKTIIKSIIRNKLHKSHRIYARKCEIRIIDTKIAFDFFENNHLQGGRYAKVNLALYNNNEIVMCMNFSRHNIYEWELIRCATLIDYAVIGGASKLFKYFVSNYSPKTILTYADRRYSNGGVYNNLGYQQVGFTKPGYWYIKSRKVLNRTKCQKSKLQSFLPVFDVSKPEHENMFMNGYRRQWDAGHLKFIYENKIN